MTTTNEEAPTSLMSGATPASEAAYEPCDNCGAPLDQRQRYCLTCGTHRRHIQDPASRFFAGATRRRTTTVARSGAGAEATGRRTASLGSALLVALVPVALGAGVLIGRSSSSNDGKLLAALRAAKSPVIQYSGAAPNATGAVTSSAGARAGGAVPVSNFGPGHGFTIELGTLAKGTTRKQALAAERADRAKGAPAVGILSAGAYRISPAPPAGGYVVFSGQYASNATAATALRKLQRAFPKAKLISIGTPGTTANTPVVNKTKYGSAHAVSGYKPSSAALSQGSQVAKQDAHSNGKQASGVGLPDVVAVP